MRIMFAAFLLLISQNVLAQTAQNYKEPDVFAVTGSVADPGCESGDPWQPAFKELFNALEQKAKSICSAKNAQTWLVSNDGFSCSDSVLSGTQNFVCAEPSKRDCSYGKCCQGGVCE